MGVGTPVKRFGLQDTFAWKIGKYEELKQHYGMTAEAMLEFVKQRGWK
jgi:transketolase C-terminal domain/subunit